MVHGSYVYARRETSKDPRDRRGKAKDMPSGYSYTFLTRIVVHWLWCRIQSVGEDYAKSNSQPEGK